MFNFLADLQMLIYIFFLLGYYTSVAQPIENKKINEECPFTLNMAELMLNQSPYNRNAQMIKIKYFDPKGGKIPITELGPIVGRACPEGVTRFAQESDKDKDGQLSFEELKEGILEIVRKIADPPNGCVTMEKAQQTLVDYCGPEILKG